MADIKTGDCGWIASREGFKTAPGYLAHETLSRSGVSEFLPDGYYKATCSPFCCRYFLTSVMLRVR